MNEINKVIFVVLLQFIIEGHGDRTKDKMYEDISSSSACFRRLNGTHQIGCSSKRGGSTGVIHFCDSENDLEKIISEGTGPPYIPIFPSRLFNVVTLHKMIDSNKISGVMLYHHNESVETMSNFTHDYQCPNPYSSIDGTCKEGSEWNPWGSGLIYADIPIPIFYVESTEDLEVIQACFETFNNFSYQDHSDRSLCSLELNSFMYGTTDTPTCIRRSSIISNLNPQKFCDPLGGSNVWATLHPLAEGPKPNETKPIRDYRYIVVAAKLDTTSMFEKTSGASNPVTGLVTLLSLAKYLNDTIKLDDVKTAKKNVLFLLFNGETYDYIGSQRTLYDMVNGNFPISHAENSDILPAISPNNIDLFIEISQLGNAKQTLYAHYLNEQLAVNNFISLLQNQNLSTPSIEKVAGSLPPASLHTFLKNISSFPGLLISDHKTTYSNHFYNSIYDNSSNINFQYYNVTREEADNIPKDSIQYLITNVTELVGKSIFEEVTGNEYQGDNKVDVVLVNELLHCYLENANCTIHHAIQKGLDLPKKQLNLYAGVKGNENLATSLASLTLGWLTGNSVGPGNINCTNKPRSYAFRYYNMSKSIYELNVSMCYQTTFNTTEAVSPAFSIEDYDWSSGQYSSWAESTWRIINVRLFLKPSASQGTITMAIGCISMALSFIITYLMKTRSHILFISSVPTEAPADC